MSRNKTSSEILRENITALMRISGYTSNRRLERASGVSDRMIGRILNGDSVPTIDVLDKLAKAFRMDGWQLLVEGAALGHLNHRTTGVLEHYLSADEEGRAYIARVAEKESGYKR